VKDLDLVARGRLRWLAFGEDNNEEGKLRFDQESSTYRWAELMLEWNERGRVVKHPLGLSNHWHQMTSTKLER